MRACFFACLLACLLFSLTHMLGHYLMPMQLHAAKALFVTSHYSTSIWCSCTVAGSHSLFVLLHVNKLCPCTSRNAAHSRPHKLPSSTIDMLFVSDFLCFVVLCRSKRSKQLLQSFSSALVRCITYCRLVMCQEYTAHHIRPSPTLCQC